MLTTGNQLKAAGHLPELARLNLPRRLKSTSRRFRQWKATGAAVLGSGLDTIKAVMDALEAAGVELLAQGPGVRLKG